jgi:predicted  nucleic acid-binding Zn-ribbon protein
MGVIEVKKMEAEKARVFSARLDLELRLEELKEAIVRIEESIQIQAKKEAELEIKIKELKERE